MASNAVPQVDAAKAVGFKPKPQKVYYNERDLMLYAVSIGIKEDELHYLYENHPNFSAFATYPLVLGLKRDCIGVAVYGQHDQGIPGIPPYDPNKLVHGDQSIEILRPLPLSGTFELHTTVSGVYDKGKGTVIERTVLMVDPKEPNKPFASMKGSAFIRGLGGYGGPKGPKGEAYNPPKDREPDAVHEDVTSPEQAILYRLSGDYNPLHIDPSIAPRVGFKKPILHGLCTYGHSAHAIVKAFGKSHPLALKSITGRFTSPVFPGDTLITKMWKVPSDRAGEIKVIYQTFAKGREATPVIAGGCAVLHEDKALQSKL
ncbi:hypothetical protein BGW41_007420 [Actinomortierella wolfii]|nr:hypothetical protein BGW41_007420 [Actinomortierella wolfii]